MYRCSLSVLSLTQLIVVLLTIAACGPKRDESWNSYYYGTERRSVSGVIYEDAADNDDSYRLPKGPWEDDQIPQGQKW